MRASKVQFHDAHPTYSEQVIEELKKLDTELLRLAEECLQHQNTRSKKDGPYPAPQQLTAALYKLARLCGRQLDLLETTPESPWYTSELSLRVTSIVLQ
jgi:hypothetical protein